MGYKDHKPAISTLSQIKVAIETAQKLIKPSYMYEIRGVEKVISPEIQLEHSLRFYSNTVSYVLSKCKWAALYLATLGKSIDEEVAALLEKNQIMEATLLDTAGTEAISQTLNKLRDDVNEIARAQQCQATVQYAPGYCDWNLDQQKILFKAIDAKLLGIVLTENCWMSPRKSVSGLIGIGKLDPKTPPPCLAVCTKRDSCSHKRVGWDPENQALL